MIRNYFRVALRNLYRNKLFSILNIFGLALSMAVCLGLMMLVANQMMLDRHNPNHERIFRVVTRTLHADGSTSGNDCATSPLALGARLKEAHVGIEQVVAFRRGFGNNWMELEPGRNVNVPVAGYFADAQALSVMDYSLQHGDRNTALVDPFSVVLTHQTARKLFPMDNPVGQVLKVGDLGMFTVTGVLEENPPPSHIAFEALASMSTVDRLPGFSGSDNWENYFDSWNYIQLVDEHFADEVEGLLNTMAGQRPLEKAVFEFSLQPLSNISPGPFLNNAIGPFMPAVFVMLIGGLALVVVLTSCFNFTNLTLARSFSRAREIGIRKINGAARSQVFSQFIAESVLVSLFALVVAMGLLQIVKPFLLELRFAQALRWEMEGSALIYAAFLAFSLVVGTLAGVIPASVLSGFNAVQVIKGGGSLRLFSRLGLRKTLLVLQFSICLIFIITALTLKNQLTLFLSADHGFDSRNKVNVRLYDANPAVLRNFLLQQPGITQVSAASHPPAAGITMSKAFQTTRAAEEPVMLDYFSVDAHYLENLKIPLLAGRFFAEDDINNGKAVVVNEKALPALGFASPEEAIGSRLYSPDNDSLSYDIIGVVKNYHHQIMIAQVTPMVLLHDPAQYNMFHVGFSGSYEQAIAGITAAWNKSNPGLKADLRLFEEEMRFFYETMFSDFVSLITMIGTIAVAIACMGLLGMAVYLTETKRKEVSIRKVMGASPMTLMLLLSRGFILLIGIAIVVAVPLAVFINHSWLMHIAYRVPVGPGIIGAGIAMLVVAGIVTVGSQTLMAARRNPVGALRDGS